MLSDDILSNIYTRFDQHRYLFQIDLLLQGLYKHDNDLVLDLSSIQDQNLFQILNKYELVKKSRVEVRKQLEEILDVIVHMEMVELRSPVSLSDSGKQKLALWLKEHFGKEIFAEFVFEPDLLGGAVLTFRGRYIDLSLKSKLLKFYSQNSDWIKNYFEL